MADTYVWPQGIEIGFSRISRQTGQEKFSSAPSEREPWPPVAILVSKRAESLGFQNASFAEEETFLQSFSHTSL